MSKKKRIGLGLIGLALVAVVGLSIYAVKGNGEGESETVSVERYVIPPREHIFVNGNIAPRDTAVYGIDGSKGTVETVHVSDGQVVEAGEKIVTYRREEIGAQIAELEYQLEEAEDAKADQPETPAGVEGEPAMPAMGADYDSQIKRLKSQISDLKSKEYTTETSDIAGKVYIEEGSQEGMSSERIVVQSQDYVVKGTVSEKDVLNLSEGMEAEITVVSNDSVLSGKLESIDGRPSGQNGGDMTSAIGMQTSGQSLSEYSVVISLDDTAGLKEGFHVQAKIVYGEERTLIPSEAIVSEGEKAYVYIVEDGALKKKSIETSSEEVKETEESEVAADTVVTKGLKQGDEIVLNPGEELQEGDIVE